MNEFYRSNSDTLLDILIPTFNRTSYAINAIQSCLNVNDPRISIFCHSNGKDQALEEFLSDKPNVRYGYFQKNLGPIKNGQILLKNTIGKYCMILSDEDEIDKNNILNLLNYLENTNETLAVINCQVYDIDQKNIYFTPFPLNKSSITLKEILLTRPIQISYLSGYIYNTKILHKINFDYYLKESLGNSYSFLNIAHKLLEHGKQGLFHDTIILMGKRATKGGHSFEHIVEETPKNIKLNHDVVGAKARARQFFYMHKTARTINIILFAKFLLYDLELLRDALRGLMIANFESGHDDNIYEETKKALNEAINEQEYFSNWASITFYQIVKYDKISFSIPILKSIIKLVTRINNQRIKFL
jgi:glycosyltransferase involved in cell wall biosynthesis